MPITEKKKKLKVWVKDQKQPLEYFDALDALKHPKDLESATSASIEIYDRNTADGSPISSKESAGLRNWAIKELQAVSKAAKSLTFLDVKYVPVERKVDKRSGQVDEYPAKLVFRMSQPRDNG